MFIFGNKAFASQVNSNFNDIGISVDNKIEIKKSSGYFHYEIIGAGGNSIWVLNTELFNGRLKLRNNRAFLFDDKYNRLYGADIGGSYDKLFLRFDEKHKNVACEILDKYLLIEELKK